MAWIVLQGETASKNPGAFAPGFFPWAESSVSARQSVAHHEAVEAELGDLPPLIAVVGEVGQRGIDLLEVLIRQRDFGVELHRRLERGLHDLRRERMELGAARQ